MKENLTIKDVAKGIGAQAMIEDEGDLGLDHVSAILYDHKEHIVNGCTIDSLINEVWEVNKMTVSSFRRLFLFANSNDSETFDLVVYSYYHPQI